MKLIDLRPLWIIQLGQRIGFTFDCPTKPEWRQSCFVVPVSRQDQWALFEEQGFIQTQGCKQGCLWVVAGGIENADFETMSVSPSLDGSAGGLWHGFITQGNIA